MKISKIKKYLSFVCMICLLTITAAAQTDQNTEQESKSSYSAETLDKFIKATRYISKIQQEGEQKMVQMIEEENLDVETFNKIAETMLNPSQGDNSEITPDQMESFNKALEKLQLFQLEMQKEMEAAIIRTGMQVEEYQQIIEDYQNDPQLQQQINEMLQ